MELELHPEFERELIELGRSDRREATAVEQALEVLASQGPSLGYPWTTAVRASAGLRELRPRSGRSRCRVLYSRRASRLIALAIAPEANSDPRGFTRAIDKAERRTEPTRTRRNT